MENCRYSVVAEFTTKTRSRLFSNSEWFRRRSRRRCYCKVRKIGKIVFCLIVCIFLTFCSVLEAAVSESMLKLSKTEELFMWGAATQPKFGLNSKLDIADMRREYAPTEFPGSER